MTQITGYRTDKTGSYIEKDPQAKLDFTMDWSDWLASGDPLRTVVWRASAATTYVGTPGANLTIHSNTTSTINGTTTAIISGGSAGNTYTVTCNITTDNGLIDERFFRIQVRDRSA